ncbi:conserved hypothetical protein [Uncinocarpus reesii 1704]|uniref:Vegetative cell wall protein gp1 n=1 Tax=Uncinocarpus reesii (strain UAMH 1704) TaxID=336963 RepID=C4JQC9_UNCRE|nr:uncharacterized protein UREG_04683 [Uncinocarpus reesii 1704]EEP79837.1 conserved hypothetical protein [Uncinocarpus reesii 1704]
MYHHYSSPPPGWSAAYDYMHSPSAAHYNYYNTQYSSPHASPRSAKRHAYRASYSGTKDGPQFYTTSSGQYPWQGYYDGVPEYVSTPRKPEHPHGWQRARRPSMPSKHHYSHFFPSRSRKQPDFFDDLRSDSDSDVSLHSPVGGGGPFYQPRSSRHDGLRRPEHESRRRQPTNTYFDYDQAPTSLYDEADSPKRSRARRASTSTRTPQKPPKPAANIKTPPKATEEDAVRAGVPAGFSIKNWDPTEAPILLLGSVFDANSLGKWIYDWTVFHYGATAPMSDVAGDLWLLLIKLAGKVKRADECASTIRCRETREMVEDFLESGERLWARFKKLLKACEYFMWKAAKRESGRNTVTMGRNAGCEFVDSIFGRDRELENTEKLMNSIRLWNMRFDANCEEILRHPEEA